VCFFISSLKNDSLKGEGKFIKEGEVTFFPHFPFNFTNKTSNIKKYHNLCIEIKSQ